MELYIGSTKNRVELDVNENFQIALNYSFIDFQEPFKQKTEFSKTIVLPGTENNVDKLNVYYKDGFIGTYEGNQNIPAFVYEAGIPLLSGNLRVLSLLKENGRIYEIECVLFGDRFNLVQDIANKTIADFNLNWDDYSHAIDTDSVISNTGDNIYSFRNSDYTANIPVGDPNNPYPFEIRGYKYPLIDFGNTDFENWKLRDIRPYPYLREVIERIIWLNNYELDTTGADYIFNKYPDFDELLLVSAATNESGDEQFIQEETAEGIGNTATFTKDDSLAPYPTFYDIFDINGTTTSGFDPATNIYTAANPQTITPKVSIFGTQQATFSYTSNPVNGATRLRVRADLFIGVVQAGTTIVKSSLTLPISLSTSINNASPNTTYTLTIDAPLEFKLPPISLAAGEQIEFIWSFLTFEAEVYFPAVPPLLPNPIWRPLTVFNAPLIYDFDFKFLANTNFKFGLNFSAGLEKYLSNYLQSEVLTSFLKYFNCMLVTDPLTRGLDRRKGKIKLIAYDDFLNFDRTNQNLVIDISENVQDNIAYKPRELQDQKGKFLLGFRKGKGYFNELYFDRIDYNYGIKFLDLSDIWNKDVLKDEVLFEGAPLIQVKTDNDVVYILPSLSKDNSLNTAQNTTEKAANTRQGGLIIGYYKKIPLIGRDADLHPLKIDDGGAGQFESFKDQAGDSFYPYFGHLRLSHLNKINQPVEKKFFPRADINMGLTYEIYMGSGIPSYTNRNVFNRLFVNRMYSMLNKNSVVAEVELILSPDLAEKMTSIDGYRSIYVFDNRMWWLVELKDYFLTTTKKTSARFVSFHESQKDEINLENFRVFQGQGGTGEYFDSPSFIDLLNRDYITQTVSPISNPDILPLKNSAQ